MAYVVDASGKSVAARTLVAAHRSSRRRGMIGGSVKRADRAGSDPSRPEGGLAAELRARMGALIAAPLDASSAESLAAWLERHFYFMSPRTPSGQKSTKEIANKLHWWLAHGVRGHADPERARATIAAAWAELEPMVDDLVRHFSAEGGHVVPKTLQLGEDVYLNDAGLVEKQLAQYAARVEEIFAELRGWRRVALVGGVKVMFASPKNFRGTSGGKYRSDADILLVRATPDVLRRSARGYGSIDYILVHELGHRFERKVSVPVDFDRQEWWTSSYSRKEGEAFAELFAIGNFPGVDRDGRGSWDRAVVERFEHVMGGVDDTEQSAANRAGVGEEPFGAYRLHAHEDSPQNSWSVTAYTRTQDVAGVAEFAGVREYSTDEDTGATSVVLVGLKGWNVEVKPEHRRKGLARAMYAFAEKSFGLPIQSGDFQTPSGEKFLANRRVVGDRE